MKLRTVVTSRLLNGPQAPRTKAFHKKRSPRLIWSLKCWAPSPGRILGIWTVALSTELRRSLPTFDRCRIMDVAGNKLLCTYFVPMFPYPVYDSFPGKIVQSQHDLSRTSACVLFAVKRSRYQAIEQISARKVFEHHQDLTIRIKHLLQTNYAHVVKLLQDLKKGWWILLHFMQIFYKESRSV